LIKHSSLFVHSVSNKEKKFFSITDQHGLLHLLLVHLGLKVQQGVVLELLIQTGLVSMS
jgi:hypothetical protein